MTKTPEDQNGQNQEVAVSEGLQGYNYIENYTDIRAVMEENLAGEQMFLSSLDMITMPSGGATAWEVETLNGLESVTEFRGVVVHEQKTRTYWESSYEDNGGGEEPDCYSEDLVTGIGNPGGLCAECPFAQFGEDGERQDCREGRSLFILTREAALPVILRLPPSSLRPYREFKLRLSRAMIPLSGIEIIITLEKDKSKKGITYSRAVFRAGDRATPEQKTLLSEQSESIKGLLSGRRGNELPAGSENKTLPPSVSMGAATTDEKGGATPLDSDTGI